MNSNLLAFSGEKRETNEPPVGLNKYVLLNRYGPVFRLSHNILLKNFPFFLKFFTLQSLELQAFYTLFRLFDKIFLWYNLTCEYCEYNFTG